MPSLVHEILDREKKLRAARSQWESHWQELAEVMLPRRADFTTDRTPGAKRTELQYDGVPMLAVRGLAAALDGLLKPKTSRWFRIKTDDAELNELDEAKIWFEAVENRMWDAIYDPRARFTQRTGEVDRDLVTFGTGIMFIGESRDMSHLVFKSIHLKDALIAESEDGSVDTLYSVIKKSARQAEQKWGFDNLGGKTKEALKGPNATPDMQFRFLQAVQPRLDREPRLKNSTNMPWTDLTIDVESEHVVAESGFEEFPFQTPRWDTMSGELYGRSPGMLALPDVNTVHQMGKTLLRAGQKAVDPPLLAPDDGSIDAPKTAPGSMIYFDVELARQMGGRPPIVPLNTGANMPLGREMQNDTRQQIFAAFFRDVLNLPTQGRQMTATEILERKEEFIRTIGPVFGSLESDYTGAVVDRVFNIMMRAGSFPEAPEELQGRTVKFDFASPVIQARKQINVAAAARQFEILQPLAAMRPEIWDNYDVDQIARDTSEGVGVPQKWILSKERVQEIRQQRAQAQQQAEQIDLAERAVGGVAKLGGLIGQVGGGQT